MNHIFYLPDRYIREIGYTMDYVSLLKLYNVYIYIYNIPIYDLYILYSCMDLVNLLYNP